MGRAPPSSLELARLLIIIACACARVLCYLALSRLRALAVKREFERALREVGVPAKVAREVAEDYVRSRGSWPRRR